MAAVQNPTPYSWREVLDGRSANLSDLWLRTDSDFRAGGIHTQGSELWDLILEGHPDAEQMRTWLGQGVDLDKLWIPFRGRYKNGPVVATTSPVPREFANHESCTGHFEEFIDKDIETNLRTGAIREWDPAWGAPAVISPLGIEPEKPRLLFDARYINLWLPDKPFSLPRVQDTSGWVGEFVAACDDKSGFHHVLVSPTSWKYLCFRWRGRVYCYCALPFGMKLSPWIYQLFSEAPILFLRRRGIASHVYIDDTLVSDGQRISVPLARRWQLCADAFFALADLRTRLGYFISRKKSFPLPARQLKHLGIDIDCEQREFRVPPEKIVKFKERIRTCLAQPSVQISDVQHLAGNVAFFSVAVPSALLFARSLFALVARANRSGLEDVTLDADARDDLTRWLSLDDIWNGISWRAPTHTVLDVTIHTDASLVQWAGVVVEAPVSFPRDVLGDTFSSDLVGEPIHVLEMEGLRSPVAQLAPLLRTGHLRVMCDNEAVVTAFNNSGGRDARLNRQLKELFDLQFRYNFALSVEWVSTKLNVADAPSRDGWWQECTLSDKVWRRLVPATDLAGPFTVDLMATSWNSQCSRFYSRFTSEYAVATDVFAQDTARSQSGAWEHGWCYPPYAMIAPVLDLLFCQGATFTIVVPERVESWWPFLVQNASWSAQIARVNEKDVFWFPPGMHVAKRPASENRFVSGSLRVLLACLRRRRCVSHVAVPMISISGFVIPVVFSPHRASYRLRWSVTRRGRLRCSNISRSDAG